MFKLCLQYREGHPRGANVSSPYYTNMMPNLVLFTKKPPALEARGKF